MNTSALGRKTELSCSEAGVAQWLEASAKRPGPGPGPGWGSARPGLRVNRSSRNQPQRQTLHKPATGSKRPLWHRGRAGTQESPGCGSGLTPKQNTNCYTGSPLPSQSSCTFLLRPLHQLEAPSPLRRTKRAAHDTGTQPEFREFLLQK